MKANVILKGEYLDEKRVEFIQHITSNQMAAIMKIQTMVLDSLQSFMLKNDFIQIMPVLLSPITDPLNHSVYPAELEYNNNKFKLTASMIFHKQLALISNKIERIFILSPNIRLERMGIKDSNNHLIEFSQFDMEIKNVGMEYVMDYITSIYCHVFKAVEKDCGKELSILNRKLPKLEPPFKKYSTDGVPSEKIDIFCKEISEQSTQPCFITGFKREFYDRENPDKPGTFLNFDLVYPEGYGEALSGAEREYEYDQIIRKMKEVDIDVTPYSNYLLLAKQKLIPRTAGAGIGLQRLMKFICGKTNIADVCMFDRSLSSRFLF